MNYLINVDSPFAQMAAFAKKRLKTSNTIPIWQLYEEACPSIGQTASLLEPLHGTYEELPGAVIMRHAASSRAGQWDSVFGKRVYF